MTKMSERKKYFFILNLQIILSHFSVQLAYITLHVTFILRKFMTIWYAPPNQIVI